MKIILTYLSNLCDNGGTARARALVAAQAIVDADPGIRVVVRDDNLTSVDVVTAFGRCQSSATAEGVYYDPDQAEGVEE